jgi:eukaryotic-like serine/threonine-protein kinase
MTTVATAWGDFALGQPIVEGWTVQQILGRGGMSIVLEVTKEPLPPRAMKVIKPLGGGTAERFMQECAVTANLEHPNIVKVENFGVLADGSPYLLMERLQGCTLGTVLDEARRRQEACRRRQIPGVATRPPHPYLTAEVLLQIVRQIGLGLGCAHTATPTVVHRDIKPDNVFLHHPRHTREVQVKLLDFGIATVLEEDRRDGGTDTAGSPPYMPPEVAARLPVTVAADVYSLAVVIYRLLTLHSPWREPIQSPEGVLRVHQQELPLPPSHWRAWITPVIDDLLLQALATDPAQRPSLGELLDGLGELSHVDDGSAGHRLETDAVVTTDPGLEGLVSAATDSAPIPVVIPAGANRGREKPPTPRVAQPPPAAVDFAQSVQNISVEEVLVGTFDRRSVSPARTGARRRGVALGAAAAATVLAALAVGGSRVWSARAPLTHAAFPGPAPLPEDVRPDPASSTWLAARSVAERPVAEPQAQAQAQASITTRSVPARVAPRPADRKPVSAPIAAAPRPTNAPVDDVILHPPGVVDGLLSNPPSRK